MSRRTMTTDAGVDPASLHPLHPGSRVESARGIIEVMFELIVAILRALFAKEKPPAPPQDADADTAYFGRPIVADEETILEVLAEVVLDLYEKTAHNNEPPEQMLYAFSMGVRITLADPGLGRAMQEAFLLPAFKDGCGVAMMDQAAAQLRQTIESRKR